ncbi:MAG: sugar phosphate isomerase/epimerase family protein [Planctomycetota bacterium]|nr:sugar phosphate isomerase/epimerase family protein [Planctomycetota bacterium]
MALLSMNETTTLRWSFEDDVLAYSAAGINAIGMWRQKLSDFGEVKGVELLEETRMSVSNLLWAGGFTGNDGRSYRDSVEDAKEAIATAAAMRAGCLVVYSGGRGGHTANHARRLLRSAIDELLPFSADSGVVLAIEPMHPGCATEWTFLTDIEETLSLLDEVDSPWVKMVLDTYHFGIDASDTDTNDTASGIIELIPRIVPYLATVHLADGKRPPRGDQNRCRLGDGIVPLGPIVDALASAGYDGYYDVELHGEETEHIDYQSLLEHSKTAFEELMGARV